MDKYYETYHIQNIFLFLCSDFGIASFSNKKNIPAVLVQKTFFVE